MTFPADLLDGLTVQPVPDDAPFAYTGKPCAWEGCEQRCPGHGEPGFTPPRKYCDAHSEEAAKRKGRKPKGDRAPGNVRVEIGLSGKSGGKSLADQRVAKVTAGATQMAQTLGTLIAVSGDAVCGQAIINGAKEWGRAIGDLSRYQPVLAKIFAPTGEVTGQGFAWIAVFAASAGIIVPVMAHHGMMSPETAAKFAGTMGAVGGLGAMADDSAAPAA